MRLVHTSDLHLAGHRPVDDDVAMARLVASTALAAGAELLAIAGDLFDHNRIAREHARRLLGPLVEAGLPVVVLPGNHDPLTPGSVYHHLEDVPNLFVLGLHGLSFGVADRWTITGRPHRDYASFPPLDLEADQNAAADDAEVEADDAQVEASHRGRGPDRIVLAHGHYDLRDEALAIHRPGWLITAGDLDRVQARYVGLGHWDRAYTVRESGPPTFYSGSPWLAGSVNVVDLEPGVPARVARIPLNGGPGETGGPSGPGFAGPR